MMDKDKKMIMIMIIYNMKISLNDGVNVRN